VNEILLITVQYSTTELLSQQNYSYLKLQVSDRDPDRLFLGSLDIDDWANASTYYSRWNFSDSDKGLYQKGVEGLEHWFRSQVLFIATFRNKVAK
jgi:hypothetical protein